MDYIVLSNKPKTLLLITIKVIIMIKCEHGINEYKH